MGKRAAALERFVEIHGDDSVGRHTNISFLIETAYDGGMVLQLWCMGDGGNDWVVEAQFRMHGFEGEYDPRAEDSDFDPFEDE